MDRALAHTSAALLVFALGCLDDPTGRARGRVDGPRLGEDPNASDLLAEAAAGCRSLNAPIQLDKATDVVAALALAGPRAQDHADIAWEGLVAWLDPESCPELTSSFADPTVVDDELELDFGTGCESPGGDTHLEGTVRRIETGLGTAWSFDHYVLSHRDALGRLDFRATGIVEVVPLDGGSVTFEELAWSFHAAGAWLPPGTPTGAWVHRTAHAQVDETTAWTGYVRVDEDSRGVQLGDACAMQVSRPVAACDIEDEGRFEVVGQHRGVATFHGARSCDGCAEVSLDGKPATSPCTQP